ncbi:hemerythrin domain-containing protein [Frateuria hangzhouensis]|uniref:hemerythrin domain-containing protein n=1 Tax=Frateuria hangzhouensis TaxID=2995589 RepID=UPI002260A966|nr:hemerythrin domain-containing protein [Frateuria sp. STR12]MCX7514814.1 hemerythrin domain-containing protein [Frateuria sp. STR12]
MNAIELLKQDHQTMRALLDELAATTTRAVKKRKELLEKIQANLTVHNTIEEEIFYPAFRKAGDGKDDAKMYFEALEEHRAAGDLVLPDLLKTEVDGEKFSGRAKVLKELFEHHADEEEKEMFKRAKALMSKKALEDLGEQLAQRKTELKKRAEAA